MPDPLKLDPAEMKKLVKLSRSKSMPFAFCPASGDEEPLFTIHRRKQPDKLGKGAKKEAEQTKVAFGSMKFEGKELVLTCQKVVPRLGKVLQKYLRANKISVKVKVLDKDGEEVT